MSTITLEQEQSIRDWLDEHPVLSVGVGTKERACSIAAINLALSGELTDRIPDCMSPVIGRWVIAVQDRMPATIRNSTEWLALLPLAAGTGRQREAERWAVIREWLYGRVLATLLPLADKRGFGDAWRRMLTERTVTAANLARHAVRAAAAYAVDADAYAAAAASYAAAYAYAAYADAASYVAADVAAYAAYADAADAAYAAYADAADAAYADAADAAYAADAADAADAAYAAGRAAAWGSFDPIGTLRALIDA